MIHSLAQGHCTGPFKNTLKIRLAEEILNMHIKNGDVLVAGLDKENSKITFEIKGGVVKETPSKA